MSENHKKLNIQQKESLVDFMQINYGFLFGKFSGVEGKSSKDEKWQEITEILNALGPGKNVEKWKKSWLGMKNEVKKKLQLKRQNENQTGAAPIDITFNALEERIIAIVGKQLMDGAETVSEIGFTSPQKTGATSDVTDIEDDCTMTSFESYEEGECTPKKLRVSKPNLTPSKAKKRLLDESEESSDFTFNSPSKRSYRSTNSQVERALALQEKQIELLIKITRQCK